MIYRLAMWLLERGALLLWPDVRKITIVQHWDRGERRIEIFARKDGL